MPSPPMPPMSVQPQLSKDSPVVGSERSDAVELRGRIAARLGPDRAKKYFTILSRFFGTQISKAEFDKLCFATLGRENLPLHNQLVRLVLKNASRAIKPPPRSDDRFSAFVGRSGSRMDIGLDNGGVNMPDLKRKMHPCDDRFMERLAKKPQLERSLSDKRELDVSLRRCDNMEQHLRGRLHAPLGIPFFSTNAGSGAHNRLPSLSSVSCSRTGCYEFGELCDTKMLQERMESVVGLHGLEGASIECAEVLNNGMDIFLRRLLSSCVDLVRARCQRDGKSNLTLKQQLLGRQLNGVTIQNYTRMQDGINNPSDHNSISMQDIQVALNLNRRISGPSYASLLAKMYQLDS